MAYVLLQSGDRLLLESGDGLLLEADLQSGVTTGATRYGVGWNGLLRALRDTQAEAAADAAMIPVACPICGEPLEQRDGILHCPFGDFTRPVGYVNA